MSLSKSTKTLEKYLGPAPGFIVAGRMTTNDDFRRPFSDKFRYRSTCYREKGAQK